MLVTATSTVNETPTISFVTSCVARQNITWIRNQQLQHCNIQEKCMVKTEGLFLNHCLLAVFDTSWQYFHRTCSVLLLCHPIPVTQEATQEKSPLKHRRREEAKRCYKLPWHLLSQSYCNTSTAASASQPPLTKKTKSITFVYFLNTHRQSQS